MELELRAMVAASLAIQPEDIYDAYDLARDGGMDSLTGIDLLCDIEEKFDMAIPSDQLPRTYGDIRRLLSC